MRLKYVIALVLFFGNLFILLIERLMRDTSSSVMLPAGARLFAKINYICICILIVLMLLFVGNAFWRARGFIV